jgi:hypothetical protein
MLLATVEHIHPYTVFTSSLLENLRKIQKDSRYSLIVIKCYEAIFNYQKRPEI